VVSEAVAIEKLIYQGSTLLVFVTTAFLGIVAFKSNRAGLINKIFLLFSFSISSWSICLFFNTIASTASAALLWVKCLHGFALGIPAFFFLLTIAITQNQRKVHRIFYVVALLILVNVAIAFSSAFVGVSYNPGFGFFVAVPQKLYPVHLATFFSLAVCAFWVLIRGYIQANSSRKLQLRYFLLASLIGSLGGVTNYFINYRIKIFPVYPLGNYTIILYTLITMYAIVRYRLLDINLVITRATVFMIVYAAVLGVPLAGALVWQRQLEQALGSMWWVGLWVAVAVLSTTAHYANLYFRQRAEERLLEEQRRYQTVLRQAAQGMTLIKEMGKLLNLIVHILTRTVRITHAAVYLLDKEAKVYVLRACRGAGGPDVGHMLPADSLLIAELGKQKGAVVQEEMKLELQGGGGTAQLAGAERGMGAIEAAVIVPSFVEEKLIGFLVLGEKKSGKMYSEDDLQVFEVLASQAALAIENAQFYDELQRTQADLFQTAKMATLGQMAGGMSHQINNRFYVLTILAGTMKAALAAAGWDGVGPELKELVEKSKVTFQKIEDNAIRGGDIVKTLLRFSRPSRGDQKPVSVQEIVETALDVVQYKIKLEELDFSKDYEPDLPLIHGNVNQLADSLFNLFSNAYDAIQSKQERLKPPDFRGSIAVTVRTVQQGRVQLTIRDNGIGMSPQEVSQLFIPFFTTKATSEKGTGLGLFVIKRIVEHHGGQIQATSQFGEGTAFIITLPAAQPAQAVA